jgi:hypothetical protein
MVSNITGNNHWENCISLDFYFHGLRGPRNQKIKTPRLIMISQYAVLVQKWQYKFLGYTLKTRVSRVSGNTGIFFCPILSPVRYCREL